MSVVSSCLIKVDVVTIRKVLFSQETLPGKEELFITDGSDT